MPVEYSTTTTYIALYYAVPLHLEGAVSPFSNEDGQIDAQKVKLASGEGSCSDKG